MRSAAGGKGGIEGWTRGPRVAHLPTGDRSRKEFDGDCACKHCAGTARLLPV